MYHIYSKIKLSPKQKNSEKLRMVSEVLKRILQGNIAYSIQTFTNIWIRDYKAQSENYNAFNFLNTKNSPSVFQIKNEYVTISLELLQYIPDFFQLRYWINEVYAIDTFEIKFLY